MPGLSKEGWRDRNSVIKVGKAAASNLMSVVCGEQKDIIEILCQPARKEFSISSSCKSKKFQIDLSFCSRPITLEGLF